MRKKGRKAKEKLAREAAEAMKDPEFRKAVSQFIRFTS